MPAVLALRRMADRLARPVRALVLRNSLTTVRRYRSNDDNAPARILMGRCLDDQHHDPRGGHEAAPQMYERASESVPLARFTGEVRASVPQR